MTRRRQFGIGLLALLTLVVSACGGNQNNNTANSAPAAGGEVTIDNESGTLWTCDFNPYNASVNGESFGIIYEPLVYDNLLTDKKTPWLASKYDWSADGKTLTFTIRAGVQWSDGQPLSADDVVYTFNLLKQNSALDLQSDWSVLSSVTKQGSDQVVMTFQSSAVPYFYQVAAQTAIVPQHVWSAIKDPTSKVAQPVGTGPFKMSQCTPQNVEYTKNSSYWQKGLPYIQTVNYPAFTDNDPANQFLAAGQAQWGGQFIPNIDTYYVARDRANNHYWFPPIANVDIWINLTKSPLDNKAVRQALAYGIDRGSVSQKGEYGYEPAGNQTGVLTPTFASWVDQSAMGKYGYKMDVNKATQLLSQAGFTKGSDGIMADSSGHKLAFTIISIAGYTDWTASLQVVKQNLQQIGVQITEQDQNSNDYFNNLFTGNYQLAYGELATSPGPSPYYELRNTLDSATTAAIGQTAAGDYERYKNPQVDSLLDQYGATTDSNKQHDLIKQVEAFMLEDVPVIPVTEGVAWYEYSTRDIGGWPTQKDPFAAPAPWNLPDWEVTLLHIYKKS
ncbi:MAG TPA: ABC transporter substrate-binding protein [Candidatus Dormibacteraeota bacterium]|nr:ABC transporter substrate-binding protein [Candidatus Dormibacteraeota bacterium]